MNLIFHEMVGDPDDNPPRPHSVSQHSLYLFHACRLFSINFQTDSRG